MTPFWSVNPSTSSAATSPEVIATVAPVSDVLSASATVRSGSIGVAAWPSA